MPPQPPSRPSSKARALSAVALAVVVVAAASRAVTAGEVGSFGNPVAPPPPRAELVNVPVVSNGAVSSAAIDFDSLSGRSGDLRLRIFTPGEFDAYPALLEHLGDGIRTPGVHGVNAGGDDATFAFVTLTPWQRKLGSYVNGYHLGFWPGERRSVTEQYENPDGFIEVTRESADTRLSTHFTLRDFLTHDQATVWPKYVVLREDLLDKLELVLDALQSFGVATQHVVVLSGFRSPQYNSRGAGEGMARSSRHQFGDAADIIIDANRDGRMDDLNGDGRVDFSDVQVLDRAVGLVEHKHPDLVGGLGLYHETGPSGPFAHIDVRGTRARWTNGGRRASRAAGAGWGNVTSSVARPSGACQADGAMAVLCQGRR
ncbi:MAG: DUF882 domain-containing protein [Gemmatimonadetes bacterium]|jgi:hypothetical protein|nr:DUF882 domain-containing protein [Gemmatimonadota bacterium]